MSSVSVLAVGASGTTYLFDSMLVRPRSTVCDPTFSFSGNMSVFKQIKSTTYAHRNNTVIPSYKNQPFITGSGKNHNVKTEIFDLRSMQWLTGADYPFTKMNVQKKYVFILHSGSTDQGTHGSYSDAGQEPEERI